MAITERIHQATMFFGTGGDLDMFGQTVSDTLEIELTPAHELRVRNTGTIDLFLGGGIGLSTSVGLPLAPGEQAIFDVASRNRMHILAGASGGAARVLIILK
jgi:cobalamin biosynthesis protein CbiD